MRNTEQNPPPPSEAFIPGLTPRVLSREFDRKIDLFGTDNFRSWMLYFVPGDGTDLHYHANPETFLVLAGTGTVRGIKGEERPVKKHDLLCLGAKDYYQITNTGSEPLVLFGNRSEAFGGPHILADGRDRSKLQKGAEG